MFNNKLFKTLDQIGFKLNKIITPYNIDYVPSSRSRLTTNFANLARGKDRKRNLQGLFNMIDNRINSLLPKDNDEANRYQVHLEIITVLLSFSDNNKQSFPITEMLKIEVEDRRQKKIIAQISGGSLSSYIRDYDFTVIFPKINNGSATLQEIEDFGLLHGILYQLQFNSIYPYGVLDDFPSIAISVSSNKTYLSLKSTSQILGEEFKEQGDLSVTSEYFKLMGLSARYFLPTDGRAPLAIYHKPDTLKSYDCYQLAALIAVMETFQKIYRPEIYNANSRACSIFKPSLSHDDFSNSKIQYDRIERESLSKKQTNEVGRSLFNCYNDELKMIVHSYML
jgi:hypothetical protein